MGPAYKLTIFFIFISSVLLFLIFSSCERNINEVIVRDVCDKKPDFKYSRVVIILITDTTTKFTINFDNSGNFFGDSILIRQGGYRKNAFIAGYACGEGTFHVEVFYNDTVDNSKMKIEGTYTYPYIINGKFYYCPNINNVCDYVEIGALNASFSAGSFYTPKCEGQFTTSSQ